MSAAQAEEHQRKHGFMKGGDASCSMRNSGARNGALTSNPKGAPKPRQNKTEAEYGLILEAMKRRGEVHAYFYEGLTLHWGDCLRYTPDFVVYRRSDEVTYGSKPLLVECKNAHIYPNGLLRFKGCRAQWKEYYDFEMWQKKAGEWRRIL